MNDGQKGGGQSTAKWRSARSQAIGRLYQWSRVVSISGDGREKTGPNLYLTYIFSWQAVVFIIRRVHDNKSRPVCPQLIDLFTPIGQYERFGNRALRLINGDLLWLPINQ
jgi:hypothetical protein